MYLAVILSSAALYEADQIFKLQGKKSILLVLVLLCGKGINQLSNG
jgi:hypothetical protein